MQPDSRKGPLGQAGGFGPDTIEARMRARVRETIEAIVQEELEAALGGAQRGGGGGGRSRRSCPWALAQPEPRPPDPVGCDLAIVGAPGPRRRPTSADLAGRRPNGRGM